MVRKSPDISDNVLNNNCEMTSAPHYVLCVCVQQIHGAVTGV